MKMKNRDEIDLELAQERTLLAAERTFSAWLRTALAGMAGGLAIMRLIAFRTELHQLIAQIMGELLIIWGFAIVILASLDYKKVQAKLANAKNYKSSPFGFYVMVVPLLVICALLVWVTLP
jgi:putative membrane protein